MVAAHGASLSPVRHVLLATDVEWIFDEVAAAIAGNGTVVSRVRTGADVIPAMAELEPDLVMLDMQTGTKGGVATCMDVRADQEAERLPASRIMLLLDRDADRWLARQAGADGWMIKPIDAMRLRRACTAMTNGEPWFEGQTHNVVADA